MGDLPFGVSRYSADVLGRAESVRSGMVGRCASRDLLSGRRFRPEVGDKIGVCHSTTGRNISAKNMPGGGKESSKLASFFTTFASITCWDFSASMRFPWIPERNGEFRDLTAKEAALLTQGKLPQFLPRSDEEDEDAELNAAEGAAILKVLMDAAGTSGIVAEDLGMVPNYVRPLLQKLGIPGFAIPIFERNEEDRSFKPKENASPTKSCHIRHTRSSTNRLVLCRAGQMVAR